MHRLTHLKTFLEAYRSRSISQAAERLGITQPAASQHIQSLEIFVGKPLFVRQSQGISPTAAADELARAVAPHLDGLAEKLHSFRSGSIAGGTVHIAAPQDFLHNRLAAALVPLSGENIRLRLRVGNKTEIYRLLEHGCVDFAITASQAESPDLHSTLLTTVRLRLVAAPQWAGCLAKLSAAVLQQIPCVAYDEELPLIRNVWQQLFKRPPDFQTTFAVPDLRIVKELALEGAGWTVLPETYCEAELAQGRLIAFNPPSAAPCNNIYLVRQKSRRLSAAAEYVKDFIVRLAADGRL